MLNTLGATLLAQNGASTSSLFIKIMLLLSWLVTGTALRCVKKPPDVGTKIAGLL